MAQALCKYHPDIPARWRCDQCQINFCKDCVHADTNDEPVCPVCGQAAVSLGAGNIIRPFWQRIPRFFIYPASLTPLLIMLAMTLIGAVVSNSIFGFLIQLILSITFMKYAYVVLEDTAHGFVKAKKFEFAMLSEELELPFKQLLLIFCFGVFNSLVFDWFGRGAFTLTALMTVAAFPASVMVLAVEHSFFKALNPLFLLLVIKRIGPAYFILCFFLSILLGGPYWVLDIIYNILPELLFLPTINFIYMYFTLIMFNMMGYVLYQYHEKLGFDIAEEYDESPSSNKLSDTATGFRNVDILLQEGKLNEAEQQLVAAIKAHPGQIEAREKLHRMHVATRNKQGLQNYSADYVHRLLHMNKPSDALRVFVESYHVEPGFKLASARERHEVAKLLHANNQPRAALSLLNNLHKEHPSYEGIPSAYLMVAQILFEYFGEEAKARQILEFLANKYPTHPIQEKVKEYMRVIKNVTVK